MAISDKLTYLADTKNAIRQAIIGKGVAVPENETFRQYASRIATIPQEGVAPAPSLRVAKFWRMLVLASYNGSNTNTYKASITILQLMASEGGPNLAVGGVATSDSEFSSAAGASAAFDGNLSTAWSPLANAELPLYIQYELPTPAEIVQIAITAGNVASRSERTPTVFKVLNSEDGLTWYEYSTVITMARWQVGETRVFNLQYPLTQDQ